MNIAIIVAGGSSSRFGHTIPKQYITIENKPMICYTIENIAKSSLVDKILVVINKLHVNFYQDSLLYLKAEARAKLLEHVYGGIERQDSSYNALQAVEQYSPEKVLIHDGARPLISVELVDKVIANISSECAIIPAISVVDTLKLSDGSGDNYVVKTLDRTDVWLAQTPQGFAYQDIYSAYKKLKQNSSAIVTDDVSVWNMYSDKKAKIIKGEIQNFKITTIDDLQRFSYVLKEVGKEGIVFDSIDKFTESVGVDVESSDSMVEQMRSLRIGSGFDVHKFDKRKSEITLCGHTFTHSYGGLLGHSDADVAWHALCDAILGAISMGDIGKHFPPKDGKWKNTESEVFLKFARQQLDRLGGSLINVDLTIICETPKIAKYCLKMQENTAKILRIDPERVSIKGTTTETLGFTGRKEGVAAQATVLILLSKE